MGDISATRSAQYRSERRLSNIMKEVAALDNRLFGINSLDNCGHMLEAIRSRIEDGELHRISVFREQMVPFIEKMEALSSSAPPCSNIAVKLFISELLDVVSPETIRMLYNNWIADEFTAPLTRWFGRVLLPNIVSNPSTPVDILRELSALNGDAPWLKRLLRDADGEPYSKSTLSEIAELLSNDAAEMLRG